MPHPWCIAIRSIIVGPLFGGFVATSLDLSPLAAGLMADVVIAASKEG